MTNTELHVDFDVKFNKLSSSVFNKFKPEEKDWYLNEAMIEKIMKTLNRKIDKSGEDLGDTKVKVRDLEALFTKVTLPVYKIDDRTAKVILPSNYLQDIEASLKVNTSCAFTAAETVVKNVKYFVLPLPTTTFSTWVLNAVIDSTPVTIFSTADLGGTFPLEENYQLINRVSDFVNAAGVFSVYWENYDGLYYKNSFVFVHEGTASNIAVTSTYNASASTPVVRNYNLDRIVFTGTTKTVGTRIVENEMEERMDKNPFTRSKKQSPVLLQFNGTFLIKVGDFNVSEVVLSYIRNPKRIDYRISQSIELGSRQGSKYKICQEIVDIAVANAAVRSMTPNAQLLSNLTT